MRCLLFSLCILIASLNSVAQKYSLSQGVITFFSEATLEDIKADNRKVSSLFDTSTGDIAFSVPISEFQFDKKLMQQHFNEKYMESDKYPRATFSGKILGFSAESSSTQQVKAQGKLTIHGVTNEINVPGTIIFNSSGLSMESKFIVRLEDYKIKIPQLMWQNIAEQVDVTVDLHYIKK